MDLREISRSYGKDVCDSHLVNCPLRQMMVQKYCKLIRESIVDPEGESRGLFHPSKTRVRLPLKLKDI